MKTGIFGGSFAPFHRGHRLALEEFLEGVRPDRCLVVPSAVPPHKQKSRLFSDRQRLEMTRLGIQGLPRTEVWEWELEQGGRSYTAETLRECRRRWPEDEFVLYVGSDMLLTLDTWYRPEEIFRLARIAVFSRTGDDWKVLEEKIRQLSALGARCTRLPGAPFPVSSTQIRQRLAAGEEIDTLVPPAVAEYLKREGFYGSK